MSPTTATVAATSVSSQRRERQPRARELAQVHALRGSRSELWHALLSFPPSIPWVLARIRSELELEDELVIELERLTHTAANEVEIERDRLVNALLDVVGANSLSEALVDELANRADPALQGCHARCHAAREQVRHARDVLIEANVAVVVSIARQFHRSNRRIPLADLVQEGYLGMFEAIARFDPSRGCRVSTYASIWVRNAILKSIYDKAGTVRIPQNLEIARQRVARTRHRFVVERGHEPSAEQLASRTGLSPERLSKIAALPPQQVASLDAPRGESEGAAMLETLEEDGPLVDDMLDSIELESRMIEAMSSLTPLEAEILRKRFGLSGEAPLTLRELGEVHDLSGERIRQLQLRALRKLRTALG